MKVYYMMASFLILSSVKGLNTLALNKRKFNVKRFLSIMKISPDNDLFKSDRRMMSSDSGNSSGGWFNGIAKLFGRDEKSIEKRKRKDAVNKAVDQIFHDTGLEKTGILGMVLKSVVKKVGGLVSESLVENTGDIQTVQTHTLWALEADHRCQSLLGESLQSSPPNSMSSSTVSINGNTQKKVGLLFLVTGSRGSAQVEVESAIEGDRDMKKVTLLRLVLRTFDGRLLDIPVGGGSSGSGGGGSIGSTGGPRGRGTIIDV